MASLHLRKEVHWWTRFGGTPQSTISLNRPCTHDLLETQHPHIRQQRFFLQQLELQCDRTAISQTILKTFRNKKVYGSTPSLLCMVTFSLKREMHNEQQQPKRQAKGKNMFICRGERKRKNGKKPRLALLRQQVHLSMYLQLLTCTIKSKMAI